MPDALSLWATLKVCTYHSGTAMNGGGATRCRAQARSRGASQQARLQRRRGTAGCRDGAGARTRHTPAARHGSGAGDTRDSGGVGDQHVEQKHNQSIPPERVPLGHMEEAPGDATALPDELRVSVSAEKATPEQPPATRAPIAEEEAARPSHLTEALAEALAVSDELRSFAVDIAVQPACTPPEGARAEAQAP